jgi:hypothetical protein
MGFLYELSGFPMLGALSLSVTDPVRSKTSAYETSCECGSKIISMTEFLGPSQARFAALEHNSM